jgi:hypothetical protein
MFAALMASLQAHQLLVKQHHCHIIYTRPRTYLAAAIALLATSDVSKI